MPSAQMIDFNPSPRQEQTPLEKTIAGFTSRARENQLEQTESDALRDIYSQYQQDGQNLERTIMEVQTRPGISPTTRVNTINQLIGFQKHNNELQKAALQEQRAVEAAKAASQIQEQKLSYQKEKALAEKEAREGRQKYQQQKYEHDLKVLSQQEKKASDERADKKALNEQKLSLQEQRNLNAKEEREAKIAMHKQKLSFQEQRNLLDKEERENRISLQKQKYMSEEKKQSAQGKKEEEELQRKQQQVRGIEKLRGYERGELSDLDSSPVLAEMITRPDQSIQKQELIKLQSQQRREEEAARSEQKLSLEEKKAQQKLEEEARKIQKKLEDNQHLITGLEKSRDLEPGTLSEYVTDPKMAELISRPPKQEKVNQADRPRDPEQQRLIDEVTETEEYKNASPGQREKLLGRKGVSNSNIESTIKSELEDEKLAKEQLRFDQKQAYTFHKETEKFDEEVNKSATSAKHQLDAIEDSRKALDSGNVRPHSLANIFRTFGHVGEKIGSALMSSDEATIQASIPAFLEGRKELFGVRLSDADLRLLQDKLPDMGKSKEANIAILNLMQKAAQSSVFKAELARKIKKENGGLRPIGFRDMVDEAFNEGMKPVKIITPSGYEISIPSYQVESALKSGGKLSDE